MSANNLMHTMPYDMKNLSNTSFRFDSRVYGIPIFLGCQVDSKFEALLLMWAYCHFNQISRTMDLVFLKIWQYYKVSSWVKL